MNPSDQFAICLHLASEIVSSYRAAAPDGFDPQNTWVTIGVGVGTAAISAGASAYTSKQKAKAAQKAQGSTAGLAFGEKPKAAEYKPVDFSREQINTVLGNLQALPDITRLMTGANAALTQNDLTRAKKLIPNYSQMMQLEGDNAYSLLNGRLPYDDVLDIVANRSGMTGSMGVPGTGSSATLRDLGISRVSAMGQGEGMMKGMVDIAEKISPISRYMTPMDMMLKPVDRIGMAMQQNQLIQQSDQSKYNIEAGLAPGDQAATQMALMNQARGAGAGSAGLDISALSGSATQLLTQLAQLYQKSNTPTGSYVGHFGTNPDPLVKNQIYRPTQYSIPV